ncbi:DNA polymerase interacting tetratricopeptide repeat-containing, protein of 47 kDa [Macrosteles quadrilineatus]|uniref:DNA polymerase interacting tetratricopeptide repeat-containing, protein of 47 kDa n=1 Tax=Macrosteles quadrilineatus TaxID=74068 RepID=UPI0023E22B72|nr:DNA polymerase interacting tetratricopeptide repeat-containing, protein of 47 kDa [Macrosteles quadrilineatus]
MEFQSKTPMTDEERAELAAKLDKDLDDFIDGLEKRSYTEGWPEDRWQEEMEKHPFFMTKPPNPEEKLSPLMEGLQQLKYDTTENTPEELAATYKEEGNFNFKCKKYRFAILSFTEGIKQKCSDNSLNAQLYNNRAAANFFLQNFRSSLSDCLAALKLQPQYEKALVRAAQCCQQLGRYAECQTYCDQVLATNPSHPDMVKLRKDAVTKQKMAERDKRKEAILEKQAKLEEEKLLKAIQERNIKVLGSDNTITSLKQIESTFPEAVQRSVHLDNGRLVWPVMFLYPEYQTTDFIQQFHEDTRFIDQLSEVFSESADWDQDRKYSLEDIRVYFEDPNGKAHLVDTQYSLGQIITDYRYRVDGGTPAFIIVVKGTKSEARLLQS